jgi:hypothetical protein
VGWVTVQAASAVLRGSEAAAAGDGMLKLPDDEPPDPAVLVTAVPTWSIGDVITVGRGEQLRVVAIDDFPHAELVEHDVRGIFTVDSCAVVAIEIVWTLSLPREVSRE